MNEPVTFVGTPLDRVDGLHKVTGRARYPSDVFVELAAHAVIVASSVAKGRIKHIEVKKAECIPGVLAVITHQNALRLRRIPFSLFQPPGSEGHGLLPLQDASIFYAGQPVALVVAETLERAEYAALSVRVEYESEGAALTMGEMLHEAFLPVDMPTFGLAAHTRRGDPQQALSEAAVIVDQTYSTPTENHNPITPFATLARWEDQHLTVHDATQAVGITRAALAASFGVAPEQVRVISTFVGGAFGCGYRPWPHTLLAAMAARLLGRPVKLVLTRKQMFTSVGHRPQTIQHMKLGAYENGQLTVLIHEGFSQTSMIDEYMEPLTSTSRLLYACPNVETSYRLVRLNMATPSYMRGPGESTGGFALESALDELSYMLAFDPLEIRLRNYAEVHPETKLPWSSKGLKACYEQGAAHIGWQRRPPLPRSMGDGRQLIGLGMATASYPYGQVPAQARAALSADGSAVVQAATTDIGPGTYTVLTQIAADALSLPISQVRMELGDSDFPMAPPQIGSITTASVGPAVQEAARMVREQAITLAVQDPASPLYGADADEVRVQNGRLFLERQPFLGESYSALLVRHGRELLEATASTQPDYSQPFASHSFGAQFAEVSIDADLHTIRVTRFVGAFAVGRILNPKMARSQMIGGIVWGIGMALQEQTLLDPQLGRFVNANLADYHIPVHLDCVEPEILFVEEHDPHINVLGAKGLGEICVVGVAAAIANAVYHATGKRIRTLPITLEKLL